MNEKLKGNYYEVKQWSGTPEEGHFDIEILATSSVFEGHFPGRPICPGVCGIAIIRNCAAMLVNCPLTISAIKQCRFVEVATPQKAGHQTLDIKLTKADEEGTYKAEAIMHDNEHTYLTFKGLLKA